LNCRICGDIVDTERVALGYDYCLKDECQQRGIERVELAALGVNKAADYYTRADEVLGPRLPAPAPDPDDHPDGNEHREAPHREEPRPETTIDRLRRAEAELDTALKTTVQRFQSSEITAREMDRLCDQLVEAFNSKVRAENIRYRSMLRPRSGGRR
jgi:hypothetical protein